MVKKQKEQLFVDYYDEWIETYKVGAIQDITLKKYYAAAKFLRETSPKLLISDLDRKEYQKIINEYAKTHEKQTTIDMHHIIKGCIKDLFYDGRLDRDPTYKVVLKGAEPRRKKRQNICKLKR